LEHEISIWERTIPLYKDLQTLLMLKSELFRGLDSNSPKPPAFDNLHKQIHKAMKALDEQHNVYFGSLFRVGHKLTHFAGQVLR
jgi:hypothetical protein